MIERIHTTKIKDAAGEEHQYSCVSFGAKDGVGLGLKIMNVVAGPIGDFLSGGGLDIEVVQFGEALRDLPARIMAEGGFDLFAKILQKTRREEQDEHNQGKFVKLSDENQMDRIFAGNYVEFGRAVMWVIEVNYLPFTADGSSRWTALWSGLTPSSSGPKPAMTKTPTKASAIESAN